MKIIVCGKDQNGKQLIKKNRGRIVLIILMMFFGCDQKPSKQVITYEGLAPGESSFGPTPKKSSPQGNSSQTAAPSYSQQPTSEPPRSVPVKTTPSNRTGSSDMKDGGGETIWFGTVPDHLSVPWTKPQDLVLDETFPSESNRYSDGNFCFANGSIQYIQVEQGADPEALRDFFTIAGNDTGAMERLYPNGRPKLKSTSIWNANARMSSSNNAKQIALGFMNYQAAYRRLPSAIVFGPDGKPWHSWRVAVLPYLGDGEGSDLFKRYNFNAPWDDPSNEYVLTHMPSIFKDPVAPSKDPTHTKILLMTGPGTAFPNK